MLDNLREIEKKLVKLSTICPPDERKGVLQLVSMVKTLVDMVLSGAPPKNEFKSIIIDVMGRMSSLDKYIHSN